MGELTVDEETKILERFINSEPLKEINAICKSSDIVEAVQAVRTVTVKPAVMKYITLLSDSTRKSAKIFYGVSPRASLSLMRVSQAYAAISGRDYVTPDDVRFLAPYVFAHRIIPSSGSTNLEDNRRLVKDTVDAVEVPVEDWKA